MLNKKISDCNDKTKKHEHKILNKLFAFISHFQHLFWIICIIVSLLLFKTLMPDYIWRKIYLGIMAQQKLVILGLLFSVIALSLIWSFGQRIDVWIFMHINKKGQRPRWLDLTILCITQLGNFVFVLIVALILLLSGHNLLAVELVLGVLLLSMVVQSMKALIRRKRPYSKLENIRIVGGRNSGHSFPSGHTSQAFFMVSLMLHYYQVNIFVWLTLYFVAALVGYSRIYVGMHYPRDVIAGAILGTVWGSVGVIINSYIFNYLNIT